MLRRSLTFVIGFVASVFSLDAQSALWDVTSAAGGYRFHGVAGSLHWTVGETVAEHFTGTIRLGQGFHDAGGWKVVSILSQRDVLPPRVWPNPVRDILHLEVPGWEPGTSLRVWDMAGHSLGCYDLDAPLTDIRAGHWPAGMYLLTIHFRAGGPLSRILVNKMEH